MPRSSRSSLSRLAASKEKAGAVMSSRIIDRAIGPISTLVWTGIIATRDSMYSAAYGTTTISIENVTVLPSMSWPIHYGAWMNIPMPIATISRSILRQVSTTFSMISTRWVFAMRRKLTWSTREQVLLSPTWRQMEYIMTTLIMISSARPLRICRTRLMPITMVRWARHPSILTPTICSIRIVRIFSTMRLAENK